jgi:hypothetical protein
MKFGKKMGAAVGGSTGFRGMQWNAVSDRNFNQYSGYLYIYEHKMEARVVLI